MLSSLQFSGGERVPVVLQGEATECGLACLAMILARHGHHTDLPTLRQRFSCSLKGVTLARLMEVAGQLDLLPRPVKVELEDLDKLERPAVLHWDFNHFVVLVKVTRTSIVIHDPARGRLTVSLAEASKHFTGIALELSPTADFRPRVQRQRVKLGQLIGRLPGLKRTLGQVFLLAAVLEVFLIIGPFYIQLVVDNAVVSEDRDLLTVLAVGFLLLALMQVGVTALRGWVVMVLSTSVNLKLMANLFRHLLALPMDFFGKRHLGDIVSRFESLNAVQRTLTTTFIEALVDGLLAIATLLMMLLYSPTLTMVVVAAAVLYAALRLVLFNPLRRASEDRIIHAARQQTTFLETLRAMQSVKLFNRQPQRLGLYHNRMVDTFNNDIRVQKLQMVFQGLNGSLFGIENVVVIWAGALLVLEGGFSVGMLFAFIAYKQQFTRRTNGLIDKAIEFRMLGMHLERVGDVALAAPEKDGLEGLDPPTGREMTLEVRDLAFAYGEAETPILQGIDLTIQPGESVAIVGPSGCGKSTLLKLLLGLLQPSRGQVLLGGVPLAGLAMTRYRELVGAVMQDDQLIAGSIADNISFCDPQAHQGWIEHCARLAAIDDDIRAMPMGYNTLIGDMGTVLSGGQKQRVQLARALYKRPRLLFLDEATSHLDPEREARVNEAIRQMSITRIFIAHRIETIASADRVILLSPGGAQTLPPGAFAAKTARRLAEGLHVV